MTEPELKKDWLAGNGVIAFASAFLLAQQWRSTDAVYELPFNLTIPDPFTFTIAAFLFILSLLLTLASVVPARWIPSWVIPVVSNIFSPTLALLALFTFGYSLITGILELPGDQWWTSAFGWGGLVMFFVLMYRALRAWFGGTFHQADEWGKSNHTEDD